MHRVLNWGLIGVGGMGGAHLNTLLKLETEKRVRLRCVADPFADRLTERKQSLEQNGVRWYSDYEEMLRAESELDAVSICTPIPLHHRMTKAALARGVFTYLEKPPVPLIQQLDELIALDSQRRVAVGFQMIGSEAARQLKRWKTDGALGDVSAIRVSAAWPRMDSYYQRAAWAGRMTLNGAPVFDGPLTNANAHLVHTIMFLAGNGPDEFAVPREVEGELYRARPIEGHDVACVRGKFASGVAFSCAVTHATEKVSPFHIEVIGSNGKAWLADNGQTLGNDLGIASPIIGASDAFHTSYLGFVEFVAGVRSRPFTRLADTRGYVVATNGALVSSSGIHTIPSAHWHIYRQGDDSGYDVRGLADWIVKAGGTGASLSEQGVPWARKGSLLALDSLRAVQLHDYGFTG
jgi:predicted dehydrogenase